MIASSEAPRSVPGLAVVGSCSYFETRQALLRFRANLKPITLSLEVFWVPPQVMVAVP